MAVLAVHERNKGVYWNDRTQLQDKILYKIHKLSYVHCTIGRSSLLDPEPSKVINFSLSSSH